MTFSHVYPEKPSFAARGVLPNYTAASHIVPGAAMANTTWESLIISQGAGRRSRLVGRLAQWRRRSRGRAALARFDAQALRDIGLTPAEAALEISKPFWRA
jgi:uncharacterized protein YjiS (DUF1127 family)